MNEPSEPISWITLVEASLRLPFALVRLLRLVAVNVGSDGDNGAELLMPEPGRGRKASPIRGA